MFTRELVEKMNLGPNKLTHNLMGNCLRGFYVDNYENVGPLIPSMPLIKTHISWLGICILKLNYISSNIYFGNEIIQWNTMGYLFKKKDSHTSNNENMLKLSHIKQFSKTWTYWYFMNYIFIRN